MELGEDLRRSRVRLFAWAGAAAVLTLLAAIARDERLVVGLWAVVSLTGIGGFVEFRRHRRTLDEMMRVAAAGGEVAPRGRPGPGTRRGRQPDPQVFRDRRRQRLFTIVVVGYLLVLGFILVADRRGPARR